MSNPDLAHHVYRFGEFTLDIERGAVLRIDEEIRLRPKAFEVLRYLVEHHGQLVSKDELLDAVWSPAVVTEDSVTQCLMEIRQAIDDHDHALIRTVPRRGCIFEGAVSGPETVADPETVGQPITALAPIQPPRRHRRQALLALLAVLILALWWRSDDSTIGDSRASAAASDEPIGIAVLPFADMSPSGDHAWFADGISEEILNHLARAPGLRVIARTSSFSFKDKPADIGQIRVILGVDHVLQGSVRTSGDQVRITAQLIRTADSSQLWSQTYDRKFENALQLQNDIAVAVTGALEKQLAPAAGNDAARIDPGAYEAYLQGRFYLNRRGGGDIARALRHYGQAVRHDPTFARAWAGLAGAWRVHAYEPGADTRASQAQLKATAERAIRLDPTLAEAHVRLGQYYQDTDRYARAATYFEKAFALEPDDPFILSIRAVEADSGGHVAQAIALQRRAIAADPLSFTYREALIRFLTRADRRAEAQAEINLARPLFPGNRAKLDNWLLNVLLLEGKFDEALQHARALPPGARRDQALAMVHSRTGRVDESRAAMTRLEARQDVESAIALAEVQAFLGDLDAAFHWLDVARSRTVAPQRDRASWQRLYETAYSPFLDKAHADPRWEPGWKACMTRWRKLRDEYAGG